MKTATDSTIVTLTLNPTIDVSAKTEHVVDERKLRCHDSRFDPGGGGLNVARAVTRLGGEAIALYSCGGAGGTMLESLLDAEKIDHRPIRIEDSTRQNFIVFEAANERQFRFGLPGPTLTEQEWRGFLDEFKLCAEKVDYIVASGSLPPGVPDDFYARAAKIADQANARLILDASGPALKQALDENVFLIKPNLRELADLLEIEIDGEEQQEEAVAELVGRGHAGHVVLSLGGGGAVYHGPEASGRVHAPSVRRRSSVGAGDSMVGGMALALSRGENLERAVRFGIAAGSSAVMSPGTELCRREETEKLFHRLE